MSQTSIGPDDGKANESHGSDGRGNKTLGEQAGQGQKKPVSADVKKAIDKEFPDGPNVGPGPFEKEAAQGKLPTST